LVAYADNTGQLITFRLDGLKTTLGFTVAPGTSPSIDGFRDGVAMWWPFHSSTGDVMTFGRTDGLRDWGSAAPGTSPSITTFASGFRALSRLVPLNSQRTAAARHRTRVEASLRGALDVYLFRETGSFTHGTGIRGHCDVDLLVSIKGQRPGRQLSSRSPAATRPGKSSLGS
jgi:hypothetical protein